MRVSFAILGVSAISALMMTAGFRTSSPISAAMAPPASVEATRPSSAADGRGAPSSQAWIDPPRRLVRARGEEPGGAAEGPRGPEPATTGTLTHIAVAVVPGIEGTAHAPPALKRERTAAPAMKRPSSTQSLRKAQARKAVPPAESPPRPAEQPEAAPRPVALAGPLGDILRGLGLVEGYKPSP